MNTIAHNLFYELVWSYAEYDSGSADLDAFLDTCEHILGPYVSQMGEDVGADERDDR